MLHYICRPKKELLNLYKQAGQENKKISQKQIDVTVGSFENITRNAHIVV